MKRGLVEIRSRNRVSLDVSMETGPEGVGGQVDRGDRLRTVAIFRWGRRGARHRHWHRC